MWTYQKAVFWTLDKFLCTDMHTQEKGNFKLGFYLPVTILTVQTLCTFEAIIIWKLKKYVVK